MPRIADAANGVSFQGAKETGGVAGCRSDASAQGSEAVAFKREKTASVVSGGFFEMERAKRLELIAQLFEELKNQIRCLKAENADALIDAHAETPHPSFGDIRGDGSLKTRDPIPEGGRVLGQIHNSC